MASNPIKPTRLTTLQVDSYMTMFLNPVAISTAAAVTYTADQVLGGFIARDCNGAGRADVMPTATQLFNELALQSGSTNAFSFVIRNTSAGATSITLTAGTGITISGTATVAQNNSKLFYGLFTADNACTIYSIGTFVH